MWQESLRCHLQEGRSVILPQLSAVPRLELLALEHLLLLDL